MQCISIPKDVTTIKKKTKKLEEMKAQLKRADKIFNKSEVSF